MIVFAVQRFSTATVAPTEFLMKLYRTEELAQRHADLLNEIYAKDFGGRYRARVEQFEVYQVIDPPQLEAL